MKYFPLFCLLVVTLFAVPFGCVEITVPSTNNEPSSAPSDSSLPHSDTSQTELNIVIETFNAEPSVINNGDPAKLSWIVSGATNVTIDQGIGKVNPIGEMTIFPSSTTIYKLTAENASNTAIVTTKITVSTAAPPLIILPDASSGLPVIHTFTAEPGNITAGESSILTWNISNVTFINISPRVFRQLSSISPAGSASVSPSQTTVYTLTAQNTAGIQEMSVTVTVSAAPQVSLNWAGTWDTEWGEMQLTQTGNHVSGTYSWQSGKIDGTISGNTLLGTWSEAPSYLPPDDAGDVELTISPDFNSISGQWRYGSSGDWDGSWEGQRVNSEKLVIIDG